MCACTYMYSSLMYNQKIVHWAIAVFQRTVTDIQTCMKIAYLKHSTALQLLRVALPATAETASMWHKPHDSI
jgi:hypothetical protein